MCELFVFLMGMWTDVKKKTTIFFWWFGRLATRSVRLISRIDLVRQSYHLGLSS